MNDFLGNTLELGDDVAYALGSSLYNGVILEMRGDTIIIATQVGHYSVTYPTQIIKIPKEVASEIYS